MKRSTPLRRTVSLQQRGSLATVTPLESHRRLERRSELAPVSDARRAEMRQRRRTVDAVWGRRESQEADPMCQVAGCIREADDVHEPHTRARGGSAADAANMLAVCRPCHDWIHEHPAEAQRRGLLVSSWGPGGDAA